MSGQLPQVFISYQREDEAFARQVREHLTANRVKTWMDQYDIPVGAYWTDEVDKGLAGSDVVVGILSPDAVDSRNVKNEWDWAIQNGKRLVLLQVTPCVMPHRYVSINFIDATRDAEMAVQQLAAVLARQDAFVALPLAGAVVRTHSPASSAVEALPVVADVPAEAPDEPFVGRERELAQARSALDAALAGRRQLLLLAGEPGIGKTRLAQQLTREAHGRGARVFWGHCYEWEGAPPYWPWIELLRTYAESLEPAELRRQLGAGAPFVIQIVPELVAMLPELPVLPPMNPEQARFRLFDAVARFVQ